MPRVFGSYRQYRMDDTRIVTVRADTRLYFGVQCGGTKKSWGRCVGAFYLINPGSAESEATAVNRDGLTSHRWGPLVYHREDLLPTLERVLDEAYCRVRRKNAEQARGLLEDGYVQILNLAYVKSASDAGRALTDWRSLVEQKVARDDVPRGGPLSFVVFGWGNRFHSERDGRRVTSVLRRCVDETTLLIYPCTQDIWEASPVTVARVEPDELSRQLRLTNNYPCGASHYPKGDGRTRREYCTRYARTVGPLLGECLVSRE